MICKGNSQWRKRCLLRGQGEGANRGKTQSGNYDDLGMDRETASHGPLENGVQRNASRFETEKNVNAPLVTSDPFSSVAWVRWQSAAGTR